MWVCKLFQNPRALIKCVLKTISKPSHKPNFGRNPRESSMVPIKCKHSTNMHFR